VPLLTVLLSVIQKCTSQYFLLDKHMISLVPGLLKLSFKHFQGPSKVANMIPFPIFHGFHEPLCLKSDNILHFYLTIWAAAIT